MGPDQTVEIMRKLLVEAMLLSAPLLVTACLVSLVVSPDPDADQCAGADADCGAETSCGVCCHRGVLPWMVHRLGPSQ